MIAGEDGGAAPRTTNNGARSPDRRIRDALGALVRELGTVRDPQHSSAIGALTARLTHAVAEHPSAIGALTARVTHAAAGIHASWNTIKAFSRVAGKLAAQPTTTTTPTHMSQAASLGLEIGRSPRYQFGERLGAGGMAEVYRGWQIGASGFERPVAIKRMLPKLAHSAHYKARFIEEADIIARLSHPNIVGALDFVNDDGQLLLVLEYVDGIDLAKLIASGPVPPSVIAFLGAEVLSGLGYAHHLPADGSRVLGVVHRDLSPHNVLLSWDGAVKVADFGIAKLRDETEVSVSLHVQGKIGFMSPEQLRGQPLDGRADLFSLGVILWEMLAGERLFAHEQRATAIEHMLACPVPRPSMCRPVPRDLERVVMKLLRPRRDRRYRTAEAAFDALAKCDDASSLRGRAELVELLARRFPAQAAQRPTRRPPPPHTPTPAVPPPPGVRPTPLRERCRGWMRKRRWDQQRRRARRLTRPWPGIAIIAVCLAVVLGLVACAAAL